MPRLALLSALLLPACIDREISQVEPIPENVENLAFTVELNPNLDLLFVIDDSRSMEREQDEILANFQRMIDVLENLPTGRPNLHIGVISTDVGAGESCSAPSPPPGVLRNAPTITGCAPPSDRWIVDVDDGAGGRDVNYDGTLADTFQCIARLGIGGCGFEQPLEALRRALDPATLENQGFLRDDALLAVVFLTDEDDCSAFDHGLFTRDTGALGPVGNFRCFREGIACDGLPPETLGPREACAPRDDSPYLTPVGDYVAALKAVKPYENRIVVAGIMGDPDVVVGYEDDQLEVLRSCEIGATDPQGAYPPIRTDAFLAQFENRVRTRICDDDLSPAIDEIAQRIRETIIGSCLRGDLGPNPECSVTEIKHPGTADEARRILPRCAGPDDDGPCWVIEPNAERCEGVSDHLLEVTTRYPADAQRDPDTRIEAQCRVR